MPVVDLSIAWLVVADVLAWAFFHLLLSYAATQIPFCWFVRRERLFRSFRFEREGDLWQRLFRIKAWKGKLPDGAQIFKSAYSKQALHGNDTASLAEFLVESRRAELTHGMLLLPLPLFLLWNPLAAFWWNAAYAFFSNLPFILAQRYNRPRLERIIQARQHKSRAAVNR